MKVETSFVSVTRKLNSKGNKASISLFGQIPVENIDGDIRNCTINITFNNLDVEAGDVETIGQLLDIETDMETAIRENTIIEVSTRVKEEQKRLQ